MEEAVSLSNLWSMGRLTDNAMRTDCSPAIRFLWLESFVYLNCLAALFPIWIVNCRCRFHVDVDVDGWRGIFRHSEHKRLFQAPRVSTNKWRCIPLVNRIMDMIERANLLVSQSVYSLQFHSVNQKINFLLPLGAAVWRKSTRRANGASGWVRNVFNKQMRNAIILCTLENNFWQKGIGSDSLNGVLFIPSAACHPPSFRFGKSFIHPTVRILVWKTQMANGKRAERKWMCSGEGDVLNSPNQIAK